MKWRSENKMQIVLSAKTIIVLGTILSIVAIVNSGFKISHDISINESANNAVSMDSIASVKAFEKVYKVLMSPRCMNCHPAGDIPLQGDDNHLHSMFPKRGEDGKGIYAMKCQNCHQSANLSGLHTPPGNPNWHLPPAEMRMVFQGRTARQLAKQLVDQKQNGHKNMKQLIDHASDGLVRSAWNPGEGRTTPPMSHDDFKKAWVEWIQKGAYAPK